MKMNFEDCSGECCQSDRSVHAWWWLYSISEISFGVIRLWQARSDKGHHGSWHSQMTLLRVPWVVTRLNRDWRGGGQKVSRQKSVNESDAGREGEVTGSRGHRAGSRILVVFAFVSICWCLIESWPDPRCVLCLISAGIGSSASDQIWMND